MESLSYYGVSWGGALGAIMPAIEPRIKVNVLYVAGLNFQRTLPECDQINYVTRVTQPTLMLNGEMDFFFPLEDSQDVMMAEVVGLRMALFHWGKMIDGTFAPLNVDMIVKEKLLAATAEDTSYSRCISGMTMRTLKCPWTEEWAKPEAPLPLSAPYQMLLSSDYIQGANDHRREDLMTEAAGQGVAFVTTMKPARQIVFDMVEEALAAFEELTGETL